MSEETKEHEKLKEFVFDIRDGLISIDDAVKEISQLKAENERLEKENEQYDEDLKNAILKYLPLKDENEKLRQIKNVRILAENFDLKLENERLNLLERERRDSAARALLGLRWKDLNDTE